MHTAISDVGSQCRMPQASASRMPEHSFVQTYEGGMGGEPSNEAHGGYAYCGAAAAALAGCLDGLDTSALQDWAASMQVCTAPATAWLQCGKELQQPVQGSQNFEAGGGAPVPLAQELWCC